MGEITQYITTEQYRHRNISKRLFNSLDKYQSKYGNFRATYQGYITSVHPYVNGTTKALLFENLYDMNTTDLVIEGSFWLNKSRAWELANIEKGGVYEFEARSQLYHTGRIHTAEIYRTTLELYRLLYIRNISFIHPQPYPYWSILDVPVIDTHYKTIYEDVSHFFTTFGINSKEEQDKYVLQLVDCQYKKMIINSKGNLNCNSIKPRVMLLESWNKLTIEEQQLF